MRFRKHPMSTFQLLDVLYLLFGLPFTGYIQQHVMRMGTYISSLGELYPPLTVLFTALLDQVVMT